MYENKKIKFFIEKIESELQNHGFRLELRDVAYLRYAKGIIVKGYFHSEEKKIVVAKKPNKAGSYLPSIETLIHEYAHFTQWRDQIPLWQVCCEQALSDIDRWLAGTNVRRIKDKISQVRDLELDNEKRAVNIIRDFDLDLDIEAYTKRANAYVIWHNWLAQTRRFTSKHQHDDVLNLMSSKFDMDYSSLNNELVEIYKRLKV